MFFLFQLSHCFYIRSGICTVQTTIFNKRFALSKEAIYIHFKFAVIPCHLQSSPEDPKAKEGSGQNERHEKKSLQINSWYCMLLDRRSTPPERPITG